MSFFSFFVKENISQKRKVGRTAFHMKKILTLKVKNLIIRGLLGL